MKKLLIFLLTKLVVHLQTEKRKEVIIPLSRIGLLELTEILNKFNQEGIVVPGKELYINFRKQEYTGKITFRIMENRDHE